MAPITDPVSFPLTCNILTFSLAGRVNISLAHTWRRKILKEGLSVITGIITIFSLFHHTLCILPLTLKTVCFVFLVDFCFCSSSNEFATFTHLSTTFL